MARLIIMFTAIVLFLGTASIATAQGEKKGQSGDTSVSILSYVLKPVGYIGNTRILKSQYDLELKNNELTLKKVNYKIKFFDKDQNTIKEVKREATLKAKESKKYTDEVLLDSNTAKKVVATQAVIEVIR